MIQQQRIQQAVSALKQGELVILPTESVYGIAADPFNPQASSRFFAAKGRSSKQPYTVHIAEPQQAEIWAMDLSPDAKALFKAFWPGPLTVILPRANPHLPQSSMNGTVGLRCVDHPLTAEIIRQFGRGVMMSSANYRGGVPPLTAEEATLALAAQVALVVDGGRCRSGRASTVINLAVSPPQLLRLGPISLAELEGVLQQTIVVLE